MKELFVSRLNKIKKAIPLFEKRLKVKISWDKKKIIIKGEEFDEHLCEEMVKATDFGFDSEDTLLLMNPDFTIHYLNIKEFTKKTNFKEVRSRVIGVNGRAKGTIEDLTGSIIVVHDNQVGIISDTDHLDAVIQAMTSLIRGSKHANIFAYLEKQNKEIRKFDEEDLGIKGEFEKIKL